MTPYARTLFGRAACAVFAGAFAFAQDVERRDDVEQDAPVAEALESAADHLLFGRPRSALQALEPVERSEPNNPWLWFYRGAAHRLLGNPHDALEDFDRAQAILRELGNPDPELADAIRWERRRAQRQVFSLSARFGLAYDTNVSYRGDGISTFDQITGRPDGLFSSRFRFDYFPLADERQTVGLGARIGQSWHFAVEEFNFQDYGGYLSYARRLDDRWSVEVRYDYDLTFLGNEQFLSNHALTPSLTYDWRDRADRATSFRPDTTTLYYRFESRGFFGETDPGLDRDGNVNSVGLEQRFRLRPFPAIDWEWRLGTGYRLSSISTKGTEFDRYTHDFFLRLDVPLQEPLKLRQPLDLQFNVQWEIGNYRNDSLLDWRGRERSDLITSYVFVLSQTLTQNPRFGDVILHAIIGWTDARSNLITRDGTRPFTYDKVVYGLQLEWSW